MTENIINIITVALNIITIICYTVIILVKGKKTTKNTLQQVVKTIPGYIQIAKNQMPDASNRTILNFVLAELKDDFEEILTKSREKQIKSEIKKELDKNESQNI